MATYTAYDTVHELAVEQHGVFKAHQAVELGVAPNALVKMAVRGRLERLDHGLYRDVRVPEDRWTPYMAATLWPHGVVGLLGRETVLGLLDLSDVNPAAIHVMVPPGYRARHRAPPPGVVLLHAEVPEADRTAIEGVPSTTVARAIRDSAAARLGPALLQQAISDARRAGWLTAAEVAHLTDELTGAGAL